MRRPAPGLLIGLGAAALLASVGRAQAGDYRAWQGLYEGMLMEAVDGDLQRAADWYTVLIDSIPEVDPTRGAMHFWLGRARYLLNDVPGARTALQIALADPATETWSLALLGQIDAQENQVSALPLELEFDGPPEPWLHAWEFGAQGSVTTQDLPDGAGGALLWQTTVAGRKDDQIQMWFTKDAMKAQQASMVLRADAFPAWLLVMAMDDQERWYGLPDFVIAPVNEWVEVQVDFAQMSPLPAELGDNTMGEGPRRVRALAIRDVTALYTSDRGTNTILMDHFRVR